MTERLSVMVVGRGSIGARHGQVLQELGHRVRFVSRRAGEDEFASIPMALAAEPFDAAVIATETSRHAADLMELQKLGYRGTVVVEKPLCADPGQLAGLQHGDAVAVGYNLRFHPAVQALRAALAQDASEIVSARLHAAQALDSWRPGRPRESVYSAYRERGGGILRDLSHELDLMAWLFGPVERVAAVGGRYSEQTVDADDAWSILAACRRCPQVAVTLNGIDRPARRFIAVTTAAQTYHADLIEGLLGIGETSQRFPGERNESYRRMWRAILGPGAAESDVCSFAEAAAVVSLIAAIESANERRCWVEPGRV